MGSGAEPSGRTRVFAALGFLWIALFVGYLVLRTDSPNVWTIAWVQYGAVGLVHMVGLWRGRGSDAAWDRRMGRIQLVSFLLAAGLFLIGALMYESS
jgi:hypothetical protein